MSMDPSRERMVVYSDYVCPFCYLGKVSLQRYQEGADDAPAVDWRPFDLRAHKRRPDGSLSDAPDGKDEAYFQAAKRNVERLCKEWGVEMALDLARDVDPWNAQKAALHVRRHHGEAAFLRFHDGIFAALWNEGRDIGDVDVLADVAQVAGLDPDDVRQAVQRTDLDEAVRAAFAEAQQAGVTGVPSFEYGRYRLPGAVPPSTLEVLVRRVREGDRSPAEDAGSASGD